MKSKEKCSKTAVFSLFNFRKGKKNTTPDIHKRLRIAQREITHRIRAHKKLQKECDITYDTGKCESELCFDFRQSIRFISFLAKMTRVHVLAILQSIIQYGYFISDYFKEYKKNGHNY